MRRDRLVAFLSRAGGLQMGGSLSSASVPPLCASAKMIKPSRSDDNIIPLSRSTDQLLPQSGQFFMPRGERQTDTPYTETNKVASCWDAILGARIRRKVARMLPLVAVGSAGVLFALQALVMKAASTFGAGTFEVVAVRGSVQASAAMGILLCNGIQPDHWFGVTGPQRRLMAIRALVGFGSTTLSFASYHYLPIGDATSIQFISPVFSVLVAWFLMGEGATRLEIGSIAASLVGVVLVSRPAAIFGSDEPPSSLGVTLALSGAFATGVVVVLIRKLAKQLHWAVVLLSQGLGQAVLAPLAVPLLHRHWVRPSAHLWGLFVFMGLISFLAQFLFTYGLARERVGPANAMLSVQLIAAFLFQIAYTPHEPVHPLSVAGTCVIACSVIAVVLQRSRTSPTAAQPANGERELQPTEDATDRPLHEGGANNGPSAPSAAMGPQVELACIHGTNRSIGCPVDPSSRGVDGHALGTATLGHDDDDDDDDGDDDDNDDFHQGRVMKHTT